MSIVIAAIEGHDLLLMEEGSGLLIPKGIVEVKTEASSSAAGSGGCWRGCARAKIEPSRSEEV